MTLGKGYLILQVDREEKSEVEPGVIAGVKLSDEALELLRESARLSGLEPRLTMHDGSKKVLHLQIPA